MKNENELKEIVRQKYGAIAAGNESSCCGSGCGCGDAGIDFSEGYAGVEGYDSAADLGLGCGLPVEWSEIEKGQTVLDLGSGAGNDVFVARSVVGPEGRVIGVDMVPEMIERARRNAERLKADNVEFRLGDIEALPLEDESVDVAVSNCVLNLVPDKAGAFAEIHRVLRPGGHFCISDIVLDGQLPPGLAEAAALYSGCVTGAVPRDDYLATIRAAGFESVTVRAQRRLELPENLLREHLDEKQYAEFAASGTGIFSVTVVGRRE